MPGDSPTGNKNITIITHRWGSVKKTVSIAMSRSYVIVFFALVVGSVGGGLCVRNNKVHFLAFCRCESILARKSTDVILSFHFSPMSFHVPFMLHPFPKTMSFLQVICSKLSCGYPSNRSHVFLFFICCFVIVLEACAIFQSSWFPEHVHV